MKLTVVGGGSTYTPELVDGFSRLREILPLTDLTLVDPDEERLHLVSGVSKRMFSHVDYPVNVHWTSSLQEGCDGADVVLLQLRVGGQEARHTDEVFPHCCGIIGQETTGPGGFAKALRTVPVVLEVAETIRKYANKNAWIIDFTNPVGIVTRALLNGGYKTVGLCNVAIGFQRRFADLLGVPASDVRLDHVGLNHLTWERAVYVRNDDKWENQIKKLLDEHGAQISKDEQFPEPLLHLLGAIPSYYLRYFYEHDIVFGEQQGAETRAHVVRKVEKELLSLYADPTTVTKPEQLTKRGGAFYSEAAVDLIASLQSDRGDIQVVNLRNNGTFSFLPDDHVIEVPATVTAAGVKATKLTPLDDDMAGLVAHVAAYERLALEAAIHGGRDRITRALLAHPLVGQYDKAEKLSNELIAVNRKFLPWCR